MDVYCYELDGNLYINLTNRCSNDCRFCVRAVNPNYYGNDLWLSKEPTAEEVIASLPDKNYNEVVFCGYGEPTFRIKELVEIGKELKNAVISSDSTPTGRATLSTAEISSTNSPRA